MVRINLKDIILAGCLIGLAIFMIFDLVKFRGSVAGTIGPGVYPAITLGLIIVTGIVILYKALIPVRLRLILPFAAGRAAGAYDRQTGRHNVHGSGGAFVGERGRGPRLFLGAPSGFSQGRTGRHHLFRGDR